MIYSRLRGKNKGLIFWSKLKFTKKNKNQGKGWKMCNYFPLCFYKFIGVIDNFRVVFLIFPKI